ncbi:FAD-dependent oxidoreductase [Couchioplanes caeruleus]|uniref:NAD(P)/FAD-dependent oxidoreductase n=1 Tax=Couchioplanes caeruleus TaxID=56438 RepID=UPI00201C05E3|nr:FAD-dependent oxidoreductase [Couchioplanes caeruleus]UQU62855.1 FAD-dependent oxidoreductase [Couchioplanes caeruleus]
MEPVVAVVGGGYGGTLVAKELDAVADVVLIDPREAFVNAAASLRALTRPEWAPHAFFPLRTLLERGRVIRDRVVSVDPDGVTLSSGARVRADYLVLATGSGYPYPAKPRAGATDVAQQLDDLRETHKELAGAGRVLIVGGGPVGLELAGEVRDAWPDKHVTVVDRGDRLLPGFLPEVRDDLRRQLADRRIDVRLTTRLSALPPVPPGREARFTVTTGTGERIVADIWFRAFGVSLNTGFLADGHLTPLSDRGAVPVAEHLNVRGYDHVYAIGDVAGLPDPKMASYAMEHAAIVAANITAQVAGDPPQAVHVPASGRRILLPLGPYAGVGQLPTSDGPAAATVEEVRRRKGSDLFTARFAARFIGPGHRGI